ncbi:prenyltransferase [Arthrobacter sp. 35W]|uniref:prenyltransferase n=1 Tax=Arthrobacter sp. 35W TaxID=1132441 RepID=UPI00041148B4|nr:prenyltransferase [Arthrobacter sp. 35W]
MSAPRAATLPLKLLVASRPVSWVNTAFPFAAAYLLGTGRVDLTLVLGTLYFLVPYNLAMYGINDVFDYESDIRNPRKGGVEGAVLERSLHRGTLVAAIAANVPFLAYLWAVGSWASGTVLALSVFAVAAYSAPRLRFKERPFLDSAISSFHFASPALFGAALSATQPTAGLLAVLGGFFLWGMASHAFGAVQDIAADREGGVGSIATVIGAAATVRLAVLFYALAGLLMLAAGWPGALAGLLVLPYIANILPYRSLHDADCEGSNSAWKRFLWLNYATGFLVTMLMIWFAAVAR